METGTGFKFLNPYGATNYGGKDFLYPLPNPNEKWGPWIEHPNPAEPDGSDCGSGRLHVMLRLSADYAPHNWWPWFCQWEGEIGRSEEKIGVKRLRLRRINTKTFHRIIRMGYCRGADLSGADLSGAGLSGADLSGAGLSGADLSGAGLSGADLCGANLWRTDLRGADLSGASLSGANLSGADLNGADLWRANLRGANLCGASLSGANLGGASLSGADLRRANLRRANLWRVDLSGVDHSNQPEILKMLESVK
jgi:hypothetical protein